MAFLESWRGYPRGNSSVEGIVEDSLGGFQGLKVAREMLILRRYPGVTDNCHLRPPFSQVSFAKDDTLILRMQHLRNLSDVAGNECGRRGLVTQDRMPTCPPAASDELTAPVRPGWGRFIWG